MGRASTRQCRRPRYPPSVRASRRPNRDLRATREGGRRRRLRGPRRGPWSAMQREDRLDRDARGQRRLHVPAGRSPAERTTAGAVSSPLAGRGGACHGHQSVAQKGPADQASSGSGLTRITRSYPSSTMSTARSSVVTSSRTSGYFSANSAAILPIAVCENSSGALTRNRPRGLVAARGDRRRRLLEFGEQPSRALEQRTSFLGELQRARAALEQAQVQAGLQFRDAPRQGCLRAGRGARGRPTRRAGPPD